MYLAQIANQIADRANDETFNSSGTHYDRTVNYINEFLFLDLLPRFSWDWAKKEGTVTTTSGTQRYNLPRWVDNPSKINQIVHPTTFRNLKQLRESELSGRYDSNITGDPVEYVLGPRVRTNYTTGTLSGTEATKVLTGSSTAWTSSGIEKYDYIKVGDYVYTVDTVDSDTQITVFEDIVTTISSATAYTAVLDRYTIDFYPTPNATLVFSLNAYGIIPRLVNKSDIPVLPDQWHSILVKGGLVLVLKHNNDDYTIELQELEADIKKMISEQEISNDYLEGIQIPRQRGLYRTDFR